MKVLLAVDGSEYTRRMLASMPPSTIGTPGNARRAIWQYTTAAWFGRFPGAPSSL